MSIWLEGNILGTLLNYMVDKDPVAEAHKKEMEELRQFIENKNLTPELASRLLGHFEFQYQKAVENRASSAVNLPRYARCPIKSYHFSARGRIVEETRSAGPDAAPSVSIGRMHPSQTGLRR